MLKKVLISAMGLTLATTSLAEEFLFVGQTQQLTLQPSGVGACPPPCGWPKAAKDGIESVCISNAGGCQIATVKVIKDFLANGDAATRTFEARTGEWGGLLLPVTGQPLLVYRNNGGTWWAPVVERDGKQFVDQKKMHGVGDEGKRLREHDDKALEPIDLVVERIKAGKFFAQ